MDKICPLLTFDPKHPEVCMEHRCAFYTQVQGHHPQTGEMLNEWGCSISWLPVLMIENSQQQRQTGAAVESFRNEMVRQNVQLINMASQSRLEKGNGESDDHFG